MTFDVFYILDPWHRTINS